MTAFYIAYRETPGGSWRGFDNLDAAIAHATWLTWDHVSHKGIIVWSRSSSLTTNGK